MLIKNGVHFQVPITESVMHLYKIIYILCYYCHESWKNLYKNIIFWLTYYYNFWSFKYWFFKSKAKPNTTWYRFCSPQLPILQKNLYQAESTNAATPTYFKTFSSSFCKIYFELPLNVLRKTYYGKRIWYYNHIWYSFFLVSFEVKIFAKAN